jgi:hypothetical protein
MAQPNIDDAATKWQKEERGLRKGFGDQEVAGRLGKEE